MATDSQESSNAGAAANVAEVLNAALRALTELNSESLGALLVECEAMMHGAEVTRAKQELNVCASKLAALGKVVEASRANLNVLHQLSVMRRTRLDYGSSGTVGSV